jgi:hypothetical protein
MGLLLARCGVEVGSKSESVLSEKRELESPSSLSDLLGSCDGKSLVLEKFVETLKSCCPFV